MSGPTPDEDGIWYLGEAFPDSDDITLKVDHAPIGTVWRVHALAWHSSANIPPFDTKAEYKNLPLVLGDNTYLENVNDAGDDGIVPYLEDGIQYTDYPYNQIKKMVVVEPFAIQGHPHILRFKRRHNLARGLVWSARAIASEHFFYQGAAGGGGVIFEDVTPAYVAWVTEPGQSFSINFSGWVTTGGVNIGVVDGEGSKWNGFCCPGNGISLSASFVTEWANPLQTQLRARGTITSASWGGFEARSYGSEFLTNWQGTVNRGSVYPPCCNRCDDLPNEWICGLVPDWGIHTGSATITLYTSGDMGNQVVVFDGR